MNPYYRPDETAESRLQQTKFVVEATGFEMQSLWAHHAKDSPERIDPNPVDWHQISPGWLVTVGELDGRPCCIDVQWCELNGALVCFYYNSSQVVDTKQTEAWFDKHFTGTYGGGRRAMSNAMNFHHCLHAIEEFTAAKNPSN